MNRVAIAADRLSKHYRLGAGPDGRGDFREAALAAMRSAAARLRRAAPARPDGDGRDIWALDAVSFEIGCGEVVGIIGANGAGKSTLLKILSRITDPTSGEAWIDGRVGSLLEVGTGFHPELSGRENVYLSGAILGMSRAEISRRYDEIVEFSEIGRFLDTPVKRYSSGMYVRLGFAVAAHLQPEVLIVDEVLAVGDAAFQRKCLAKMQEVAGAGRTILFVSHNMGSIQALCDRAIVLEGGRIVAQGSAVDAVKEYLQRTAERREVDIAARTNRRGHGGTRIVGASIAAAGHEDAPGIVMYGAPATVRIDLTAWMPDLSCTFAIYDRVERPLCRFTTAVMSPEDTVSAGTAPGFTCEIPELSLLPGDYHVNVAVRSGRRLEDHVDAALVFRVADGVLGGRRVGPQHEPAVFAPRHRWMVRTR